MARKHEFTLYAASVRGEAENTIYPHTVKVANAKAMSAVMQYDHVTAKFRNNRRSVKNFDEADCLPMDCDNDHSDNPGDWVYPADVQSAFPNVMFLAVPSKSHMLPKDGRAARPRHHYYFFIDVIRDAGEYAATKRRVHSIFPFFDANALRRSPVFLRSGES